MPSKKHDDSPVYQLKVTLKGSKPPIWRRIQVRGSTRLSTLHEILQIVMGWTDSHLHQFIVGDVYYGIPDPEWDWGAEIKNEQRVQLGQIVSGVKDKFIYEYDFGDSWEHELVVEKALSAEAEVAYPVCLTGKRACPPEDVGGIWGYDNFLEALRDPRHPEHEEYIDWIGGEFDPETFDCEEINRALRLL